MGRVFPFELLGGINDRFGRLISIIGINQIELALAGFQEFLLHYPDDDLSDNAQYWIGECYYGLNDLDQAILEYLKVRDVYPNADKVPAATLKTGYAFLRKGDSATARRYFETVIREYPDSDEAKFAQDKLATLR